MKTLKLPKKPTCPRPPGGMCGACTWPAKTCPIDLVYTTVYKAAGLKPRRS